MAQTRYGLLISATALLVLTTACLPNPRRTQTFELLDRLNVARTMFSKGPALLADACNEVGGVQTRLYGEPGLHDQPGWPALREAADALNAVCGQATLLAQPSIDSPTMQAARGRWQLGIQRELGVACDHLRAAAAELGRGAPC